MNKSSCCKAQAKSSVGNEGTGCYICSSCGNPCDLYYEEEIIHPARYNQYKIECIDFIADMPFLEGTIIKYLYRHRMKGGIRDLEKAQFYLDRLKEEYNK